MDCEFANNNGTLKMLDGCMNDALCKTDEVQLNGAGTSKLLMNLGLVHAEKTYSDVLPNDRSRPKTPWMKGYKHLHLNICHLTP